MKMSTCHLRSRLRHQPSTDTFLLVWTQMSKPSFLDFMSANGFIVSSAALLAKIWIPALFHYSLKWKEMSQCHFSPPAQLCARCLHVYPSVDTFCHRDYICARSWNFTGEKLRSEWGQRRLRANPWELRTHVIMLYSWQSSHVIM